MLARMRIKLLRSFSAYLSLPFEELSELVNIEVIERIK